MKNVCSAGKGLFNAKVRSNVVVSGKVYRLKLELDSAGSKAFGDVVPGQFVEIELSNASLPAAKEIPAELADAAQRQIILRRPFSFCNVEVVSESGVDVACAEVLYRVVGPATLRMTTLDQGDELSVIGPLGRGFSVPADKKCALLIAGGMGAPPLLHLGRYIRANFADIKVAAFTGAKSVKDLPFIVDKGYNGALGLAEFGLSGVECFVATDDGSAGFGGFVTDCAAEWLGKTAYKRDEMIIYSCGPEAMLAESAKLAARRNIDCQVSTERMMACGIGLCQSCAVEVKVHDSDESEYKLCCKDGPVFDGRSVVFGR